MEHILEIFHSEHDEDLLDVDLHMIQSWLVVNPSSKICTFSTVLFHKYGGENAAVKNCMSHFYMFVPTNSTVRLANGNTVNAQVIGTVLWHFPKCYIIYLVVPVYYCPGHPSKTISSGSIKFYVGFQKVTSEPL